MKDIFSIALPHYLHDLIKYHVAVDFVASTFFVVVLIVHCPMYKVGCVMVLWIR